MLRRRAPLKKTSGLTRKVPINKVGRVTRYRADRKKQWIRDHPPTGEDDNGQFWIGHICHKPVYTWEMKLDHVLPKGSTPKAIAEADNNLKPEHDWCNNEKGSKRL